MDKSHQNCVLRAGWGHSPWGRLWRGLLLRPSLTHRPAVNSLSGCLELVSNSISINFQATVVAARTSGNPPCTFCLVVAIPSLHVFTGLVEMVSSPSHRTSPRRACASEEVQKVSCELAKRNVVGWTYDLEPGTTPFKSWLCYFIAGCLTMII